MGLSWRVLAAAVLVLGFSGPAHAGRIVRLFSAPGVQVPEYTALVSALSEGDTVEFSNGARFEIRKVLGAGNTTKILGIDGGRALRIPLKSGHFDKERRFTDLIDSFLDGYKALHETGGPVLEVFEGESLRHEYAVVERVEPAFDYADFLAGKITLAAEERARVNADFIEFARKTWAFAIVGDQFPEQIVYVRDRGWLFIDFDARHKRVGKVDAGTVFTKGYDELMAERYYVQAHEVMLVIEKLPIPRELITRAMAAIQEERLRNGLTPPFSCAKWLKEKWLGVAARLRR